jgi:hypothetical protein
MTVNCDSCHEPVSIFAIIPVEPVNIRFSGLTAKDRKPSVAYATVPLYFCFFCARRMSLIYDRRVSYD